jgi:hypothetical protein
VGHGGPGGLRPPAAPQLPGHGRHPHVLQHRLARLPREHTREVEPGGEALLPQRAHCTGGQQARPAQRRGHQEGADEAATGAGAARPGPRHGRQDRRLRLPGVLGEDQGGRARRVRDGHARRPALKEVQELQVLGAMRDHITHNYNYTRSSLLQHTSFLTSIRSTLVYKCNSLASLISFGFPDLTVFGLLSATRGSLKPF